ncbi:MAG: DUF4279 domain-containing protein [Pseudomonadota bacterium]
MAGHDETAAALRVSGDDLDPDEVTEILGHKPDWSYRKGETRVSRRTGEVIRDADGRQPVWRTGVWGLRVERRHPADLEAQIWELLRLVSDDITVWDKLNDKYSIDVFCGWFMHRSNDGLSVTPPLLHALGERGVTLDLDVYAPLEDDDE